MNSAIINDIKTEADADLIAAIALQADDKETALAALEELHFRHSGLCLELAIKQEQFGIDPETVVSRTFGKVWKRADQFSPDKRAAGVAKENAAKNWITTILKNEIRDETRARASRPEVPLLDGFEPINKNQNKEEEKQNDAGAVDAVGDNAFLAPDNHDGAHQYEEVLKPVEGQKHLLHELMSQLSEKDRQILVLSANYVEPNPPYKCRIPPDELAVLAAQIGVAPSSVKVLRQRAYIKLRKLAENHHQPQHTKSKTTNIL